ncbi:hypothetical protein CAPTEDRAFT_220158 [Capitella teleta]|uniref:Cytochrome P450 n=1 Tax=Capitella teleta TaxID=283909 RepID=R7VFE6_CAPTE|nr:hypothetical protein CAPTEDRAFT_220158 [Capitella teleta]|eukprot:ELU17287.1 hypothetical protein CAPTEDRAFT_220158 [Capitella teleta]
MTDFLSYWRGTNWSFDVLYILPFFLIIIRGVSFYLYGRATDLPPMLSGWVPWIGCALQMGQQPLNFIQNARQKLGPIFTLKVLGQRLTFVTEEEDIEVFFNNPDLDFELAVHKPVKNAASIPPEPFFSNHFKLHSMMKGYLAPAKLEPLCKRLNEKFSWHVKKWGESGSGDLYKMVRKAMYAPVVEGLFGDDVLPTNDDEYKTFEKLFVQFDDNFEYAAQIPPFFLKDFNSAKTWLMDKFVTATKIAEKAKLNNGAETLFQTLIKTVDHEWAPNFGLLMMWASLANAIPITFWVLAFILENPDVLAEVRKELRRELKGLLFCWFISFAKISLEKLQNLELIKRCILESIRLRSPGAISRGVEKEIKIKDFTIPEGDMLMLSPYWMHRNPKFFPDPEAFKPDRWLQADVKRNIFLKGFMPFGGGRFQCPGRWFALMEIQLFVAIVLKSVDIDLLEKVPDNSLLHLLGVQQPETGLMVKFRARASTESRDF